MSFFTFNISDENMNEINSQNKVMDRSPVRNPKRNTEGGTTKI